MTKIENPYFRKIWRIGCPK